MSFLNGLLGGLRMKDAAVRSTHPALAEQAPPRIAPASIRVKAGVFVTEPGDELTAFWREASAASEASEASGSKDDDCAAGTMDRVAEIETMYR